VQKQRVTTTTTINQSINQSISSYDCPRRVTTIYWERNYRYSVSLC